VFHEAPYEIGRDPAEGHEAKMVPGPAAGVQRVGGEGVLRLQAVRITLRSARVSGFVGGHWQHQAQQHQCRAKRKRQREEHSRLPRRRKDIVVVAAVHHSKNVDTTRLESLQSAYNRRHIGNDRD